MTFLLDVNVLIALIDPAHIHHNAAHAWFAAEGAASWATCPLTQNGVLRIVGHPGYANSPGSPAIVADVLGRLLHLPGHFFWPDDISLLDPNRITLARLLGHKQVTDTYLLALAISRSAKLATFDTRLSAAPIEHGQRSLFIIR